MKKMDSSWQREFPGYAAVSREERQRILDIAIDYRRKTGGITTYNCQFHDGKPYILFGVREGTENPEDLLPDEIEGIPVYYEFRDKIPEIRLSPRIIRPA